jgi:hypothetical protein
LIKSSTGAFGLLKSVVEKLNRCVDILTYTKYVFISAPYGSLSYPTNFDTTENREGCEDYNELQIKLELLLQDLNQYIGGPVNPSMTAGMRSFCE